MQQMQKIDQWRSISPSKAIRTNGGTFEGWGTSLCWWANRLGYSDVLAQKSADLFFGESGLRLNIMRYNIAGGDDPNHFHIKRTDSAVPGWLSYDAAAKTYAYDWEADQNQQNVLKRAASAAGEDALIELFSTSPPYFMTASGCSCGNFDAGKNNLKEDSYAAFADYLARVAKYINDELGIKIYSLSPMNEPSTSYWVAASPKQEGCHFDPGASQSRMIVEMAAALKRHGLFQVILAASDETSPQMQLDAFRAYSRQAKKDLGRINTHTYDDRGMDALGSLALKEKQNIWMSEVDGDGISGEGAGEMSAALWIGEKIIQDIHALSPSAWVMWQTIGSHISEKGYRKNADFGMVNENGGFWGVAVADHDRQDIILTQKYYGFGQFTRYIRPGATLIRCDGDAIAAYDARKCELVIVAVNSFASEKRCYFDLSEMSLHGKTAKVIRTSGSGESKECWRRLPDIALATKGLDADLAPNSITTFLLPETICEIP